MNGLRHAPGTSTPRNRHVLRGAIPLLATAALVLGSTSTADARHRHHKPHGGAAIKTTTETTTKKTSSTWRFEELSDPSRVRVLDGGKEPVATFTVGARSVTVRGPARTLAEPSTTSATVTSTTYVRVLPRPFSGTVDIDWLTAALDDRSPDVLAVTLQYVTGAPTTRSSDGTILSSDADYGPLQDDGSRAEGSDFNDYLGVTWSYPTRLDAPEADQLGALDCSGFTRMAFGYRAGVPLTLDPDGVGLPRRAVQMLDSAPGVVTIPNTGVRPASTDKLAPGDLVFFDASTDDGTAVDHVAIYLGPDSAGAPRFVSSRKKVNGPTMGDVGGRSLLSGTGLYATSWRAARRL